MNGVPPSLAAAAALVACGCSSGAPIGLDQAAELRPRALPRLETSATWNTCSTSGANCGGEGGIGTPVQSTFTVGSYAGRDDAAAIWIGGGVSWGTAYWFEKNAPPAYQVEQLTLRTDFYIPPGSEYEAIEWDPQQVRGTRVFNFGLQANRVLGQWRFFDYVNKAWRPTGIAWTGEEGVWHTLRAGYHTSGDTIVLDWIELDGVRRAPTQSARQSAVIDPTYTQDTISLGLQLDQAKSGASFSVYYDHVSLQLQCDERWCRLPPPPPACDAPRIAAPEAGASVETSVELTAMAPTCTARLDCYLDGDSSPVASAAGTYLDRTLPVAVGDHAVRCNGIDTTNAIYVTQPVPFTATAPACTPPVISSPTAGQTVSGTVQLTATAPSCIGWINCYLDGNPTPVYSAGGNRVDQTLTVGAGGHTLQCNGWDSSGAVYLSSAVSFTSAEACGAPVISSPTAGQQVSGTVQLTAAAPSCIGWINCYLDGNPTPVYSAGGNTVNQTLSVSAGSHGIGCNGWDSSGAVYVSPTTAFSSL